MADVDISTFGDVSVQRALHEELVERDEQGRNNAPEQQDDGQSFRIGRIPHVRCVGNHVGEV